MSDTFGTATFTVLYEGQGDSVSAQTNVMHIPYSNTNYIQNAGQLERHLSLTLLCDTDAAWATLRDYCGSAGTLSYFAGTITNVLLANATSRERTPDGHHFVNAEFTV